jgi:hypothetical protein
MTPYPRQDSNLSKCKDIADYLACDGFHSDTPSDSEPEDDPNLVLQLSDKYVGKGNLKSEKSALNLVEISPRVSLELINVENGLGADDVVRIRRSGSPQGTQRRGVGIEEMTTSGTRSKRGT